MLRHRSVVATTCALAAVLGASVFAAVQVRSPQGTPEVAAAAASAAPDASMPSPIASPPPADPSAPATPGGPAPLPAPTAEPSMGTPTAVGSPRTAGSAPASVLTPIAPPPVTQPAGLVIDPRGNAIPVGYPNHETTGVPRGVTLRPHRGDLTVDEDGAVVDGLDLDGCLTVRADDVTVTRTRIRCAKTDGLWPVRLYAGYSGLRIIDSELDGRGVAGVAVCCEQYTLLRVDVHDVVDGPRIGSGTEIRDSYIHNLSHNEGTHNDALQTIGGTGIRVIGNTLLPYEAESDDPHNGAIQTGRLHSPLEDMQVIGNFMNGGSYTVRGGAGPRDGDKIKDYVFRDNVLGHECGYGPVSGVERPVDWDASNRWVDGPLSTDPQVARHGCTKRQQSKEKP